MSVFYFSYWGNKRNEIKHLTPYINFDDFDTICEPFGGSLAFSREVFLNHPDKKYVCSDIDQDLVRFCNGFYKVKNEVVEAVKAQAEDIKSSDNPKDTYLDYLKCEPTDDFDFFKHKLFYEAQYCIRKGLCPYGYRPVSKFVDYDKKTKRIDDFFRNVKYELCDFVDTIEKVKDDERAFLYLDPPYPIRSDYTTYVDNKIEHIWKYLIPHIRDNKFKCKYILSVDRNIFTEYLFKDYTIGEYSKTYQPFNKKGRCNKRIVEHLVISNLKT